MHVVALLLTTALSLVVLGIMFRPLELAFPARRGQRLLRPAFGTDLLFFLGQYLLWNALVFGALARFGTHVGAWVPAGLRTAFSAQPFALQAVEVVVASDLFVYWGHRLQHRVPFLWRFHAVHHSAEHLDWLAAHREHPLDTVYTVGLINLPGFLLGLPLGALAGLVAFRGVWAIFIHSNVRLRLGPLRMLVGSPELHHWHHAKDRDAGNYANVSPLMDVLFGTYRCPPGEPDELGLPEPFPQGYGGQLLHPLLPKARRLRGSLLEPPARPSATVTANPTPAGASACPASLSPP